MWNTSISCISFQFSRFPWQSLSCLDINSISSRNSHLWWNSCQSVQKLKFYFENRFCCLLFGFTLPSLQYTTIDLAWISKEELAITALMVCIRVVFYVCFRVCMCVHMCARVCACVRVYVCLWVHVWVFLFQGRRGGEEVKLKVTFQEGSLWSKVPQEQEWGWSRGQKF